MEQSIEARSGELMIVPLSQLAASPANVRKTNGTDVSGLKASIEAQGVLQNLIVCPVTSKRGKPTGQFEVVGGRRRLQALIQLAAEGKVARDEGIVCRVKPSREAAEALARPLRDKPPRAPGQPPLQRGLARLSCAACTSHSSG
jgi:ParB-like chromosome segregation protein Spo0J